VDDASVVAREKEDDAGDVFGLGPLREVSLRHGAAIGRCVNDAWEYGVGAYTGAEEIGGERIDECDGSGFGGGVSGCAGGVIPGGFGRDVDDSAGLARDHGGRDGFGQRVGCAEIEIELALEDLGFQLPEGSSARIAADSIHKYIKVTVFIENHLDEIRDRFRVCDIDVESAKARRALAGCDAEGDEFFLVAKSYGDRCARVEKCEADRTAETAGASGDENDFAFEVWIHWGEFLDRLRDQYPMRAAGRTMPLRDRMAALHGFAAVLARGSRRAALRRNLMNGVGMHRAIVLAGLGVLVAGAAVPLRAATVEDFKNDKVAVTEVKLAPGEHETINGRHPSVVAYLAGYEAQIKFADGKAKRESIVRGETVREPAEAGVLTNTAHEPLHLVRVEFLTAGSNEIWQRTGLPPNYQMIFEDKLSRTYNIRVAAHSWEPQHTHHDRVVVCLEGAKLEHVLPDGSVQASTLKTDEVTWRLAQTHKGHNLGDTNLWVVAIEPK